MKSFQNELSELLNKHSKEKESNTPDFILAEFLTKCLGAFNHSLQQRTNWYPSTSGHGKK